MRLVIIGAGGYGQTVMDIAEQLGYEVTLLDDRSALAAGPCETFLSYKDDHTLFYPAFGNNEMRVAWIRRLIENGCKPATLIHQTAYVSPRAAIAPGTVVLPGAIINTGCSIRSGCIINCGAIIDHGCILEEGVHVCLGAIVKAENHLPACMKVEAGAVIANRTYA